MRKLLLLLLFLSAFEYAKSTEHPYKLDEYAMDQLFDNSVEIEGFYIEQFINNKNSPLSVLEDTEEKRIIAGVLGILLGGLGIHRFYLGHSKAAFIGYCLPTLCFGLGYLPGIVDGILYLIATDDEFSKKYRDNQKVYVWLD